MISGSDCSRGLAGDCLALCPRSLAGRMVDRRQEKDDRHCFDSMVILVCWMLWKERNDKTSDRSVRTLAEVLDWVVDEIVVVAEPPELFQLKCAVHHHKDNTDSNALQTEQFLVCRVTSRYNYRFSDRTSIPRTKASPEILQPQFFFTTQA